MSAEKLTTIFGAMVKEEASYGVGATFSLAQDGVLLRGPATLARAFVSAGERGPSPSGMGLLKRAQPMGKTGTVALEVEYAGGGAAYSASVKPNFHRLMRAAGYTATLDSTGASESYTYAPETWDGTVPPSFTSIAAELYARGEKVVLAGAYADLALSAEAGAMPIATFNLSGIPGDASDTALPAIVYPSVIPPKVETFSFQLGTYTAAKVRSVEFALNRTIAERSIYGYAVGRRAPTLTVTMEAPIFDTSSPWHTATELHPVKLMEAATALSLSLTMGVTQYNRLTLNAPAAIITNVEESEEDPVALTTLTIELAQSDAQTGDDHEWVAD
jgi:hypothetical protein